MRSKNMSFNVGKLCRAYREKRKLTREKASQMLYISLEQLGRYERGEVTVQNNMLSAMAVIYSEPYIELINSPASIVLSIKELTKMIDELMLMIFKNNKVDFEEHNDFDKLTEMIAEKTKLEEILKVIGEEQKKANLLQQASKMPQMA